MQTQQRFDFGNRAVSAFAIRFVHHENIRDLHHACLHHLHIVTHAGHQHDDRDVGGARDLDLILPDTDRLDRDDMLAGGIEHERGIRRRPRQPAQMAPRRHAANEHAGILRVRLHANAIAEHGAAAERARRIDGNDADGLAGLAPPRDQTIDERAFSRAGRAGDAHEKCVAGFRKYLSHQRSGVIAGVLDERDAASNGSRVAR